jgi:hypothetical protein
MPSVPRWIRGDLNHTRLLRLDSAPTVAFCRPRAESVEGSRSIPEHTSESLRYTAGDDRRYLRSLHASRMVPRCPHCSRRRYLLHDNRGASRARQHGPCAARWAVRTLERFARGPRGAHGTQLACDGRHAEAAGVDATRYGVPAPDMSRVRYHAARDTQADRSQTLDPMRLSMSLRVLPHRHAPLARRVPCHHRLHTEPAEPARRGASTRSGA